MAYNVDVSIIIPACDCGHTLERALDGILLQDAENFEIIIVDDASEDDTPHIIARYAQNGRGRVRAVRHAQSKGAGAARNSGLALATGEYVFFMDSCDVISPDFIGNALKRIKEAAADILVFNLVDVLNAPRRERWAAVQSGTWSGAEALKQMLPAIAGERSIYPAMYKRSFLSEHDILFPELWAHEGLLFNTQAFYHGNKMVICAETEVYRHHEANAGNESKSDDEKRAKGLLATVALLTGFFENNGLDLESEMYARAIYSLVNADLRAICRAVYACGNKKLLDLLSDELLVGFSRSRKALQIFLSQYVSLFGEHNQLKTTVLPQDMNWRAEAAKARPPATYTAYKNSANPDTAIPLLTVISGNWNKSDYLRNCVESVLGQSMQDFEWIIVDDSSTDDSWQILQGYADSDQRIRLLRMDYNGGPGMCVNTAKKYARGKYLTIVDTDDMPAPGFFSGGIELMEAEGADICAFSTVDVDMDGNICRTRQTQPLRVAGIEALRALKRQELTWGPWGKFYNREWLEECGITVEPYMFHEDSIFLMQALLKTRLCITAPEVGYKRLLTPNSSVRPASYCYTHIYTAWRFPILKDKIHKDIGMDYKYGELEPYFLPTMYAYCQAAGEVPITEEGYEMLSNPTILRMLFNHFTEVYNKSTISKEFLNILPPIVNKLFICSASRSCPLVSIIVYVSNQKRLLVRCLNSLAEQYLRHMEVILVVENMNNEAYDICLYHAQNDHRIRVITDEFHKGMEYGCLLGLGEAKGEHILLMRAEDQLLPDALLKAAAMLHQCRGMDMVCLTSGKTADENGIEPENNYSQACLSFKDVLDDNENGLWSPWGKVFRKSLLSKIDNAPEDAQAGLFLFMARAYRAAGSVAVMGRKSYIAAKNPPNYVLSGKRANALLRSAGEIETFSDAMEAQERIPGLSAKLVSHFFNQVWLPLLPDLYIALENNPDLFSKEALEHLKKAPKFLSFILENYVGDSANGESRSMALSEKNPLNLEDALHPAGELIPVYQDSGEPDAEIKISVIIYAYNAGQYIADSLNSVLDQKAEQLEIILVDDGSTDATMPVCLEYSQNHPCIRLFRTPWHSGGGAVRNLALGLARGTYVTILDGGDQLEQYFLRKGINAVSNVTGADLALFRTRIHMENGVEITPIPDAIVSGPELLDTYMNGYHKCDSLGGIVFRKKFLTDNEPIFAANIKDSSPVLSEALANARHAVLSSHIGYNYFAKHDSFESLTICISQSNYEVVSLLIKSLDTVIKALLPYKISIKTHAKKQIPFKVTDVKKSDPSKVAKGVKDKKSNTPDVAGSLKKKSNQARVGEVKDTGIVPQKPVQLKAKNSIKHTADEPVAIIYQ